jgi:hypothetical protein
MNGAVWDAIARLRVKLGPTDQFNNTHRGRDEAGDGTARTSFAQRVPTGPAVHQQVVTVADLFV